MKNAIKIFTTLALTTLFTFILSAHPINDLNRTIILINGLPFLVEMENDGNSIAKIAAVPTYFTSEESHNELISVINKDYEAELPNIKSRLLIFNEEKALLDDTAINHIRDLSRLISKGYISNIHIIAAHTDDHGDEALAAHRINAIYQLLNDFGVKDEGISADMKEYKSDLPNVYIQLSIKK